MEVITMFSDEMLEEIFGDTEMQKIPIGCQSTAVSVFQKIIERKVEVNPYAQLSELLSEYNADVSEL